MSTALQAHNGCLELFRRSEPHLWCGRSALNPRVSNNFVTNRRNHNVRHHPERFPRAQHKKPYLRVENKKDDFLLLANHLIETAKKIPSLTVQNENNCVTQPNSSAIREDDNFVTQPKSDSNQLTNQSPGKSDWVVLEKNIDNEWDYVNIENESQPSYAEIVTSNVVFVQDPLKKVMIEQAHTCFNIKQSSAKVDQESCNRVEDNLTSLEDMWFNSKYEGAKSYHRKIEKSKGRTRVIGD